MKIALKSALNCRVHEALFAFSCTLLIGVACVAMLLLNDIATTQEAVLRGNAFPLPQYLNTF